MGKSKDHTSRLFLTSLLIGLLIAILGGWGFSAILTQQNFDFTIDLVNQTISFEFGAALPYPVEIKADGRAYVNDIPLRAYLEALGWTVTYVDGEIYCTKP